MERRGAPAPATLHRMLAMLAMVVVVAYANKNVMGTTICHCQVKNTTAGEQARTGEHVDTFAVDG